MAELLERLFINVSTLPQDSFGFAHLIYLGATYAFILVKASNMIKDGSELLLLIPAYAGIVGSIVLPVLGAVPDAAIVLFSGLGPNAQEEVAVGVGALAGSTVMLLTVPWALSIWAGRVNLKPNGEGTYVRPRDAGPGWAKLHPEGRVSGSGVTCGPMIKYTAGVMLVTLLPYAIIQVPAFLGDCIEVKEERRCHTPRAAAAIGGVVAVAMFAWYLWDQARLADTDEVKQDRIDQVRAKAISQHYVSLRGLFPSNVSDEHGTIRIAADEPRFRHFLMPFFRRFDSDNSGAIERNEFAALLHSLGEAPEAEVIDALLKRIDKDNSGSVEFGEFCEAMVEIITGTVVVDAASIEAVKQHHHHPAGEAEGEEDAEAEEEAEMPEDLAQLSPEQQQSRLLRRSLYMMGVGVTLVVIFSDPAVAVLSELGARTGVKPFYISFVLAPLASNGSELLAAFAYASKKTEKTITISFASLLGAAISNNTFCVSVFLFLVWYQQLKWIFFAETLVILLVELAMAWFARQRTHPTWYAAVVLSLFPLAMISVAALESVGYD